MTDNMIWALIGAIIGFLFSLLYSPVMELLFQCKYLNRMKGTYYVENKYAEPFLKYKHITIYKVRGKTLFFKIISFDNSKSLGQIVFETKFLGRGHYKHKYSDAYGLATFIIIDEDTIGFVRQYTDDSKSDSSFVIKSNSLILRRIIPGICINPFSPNSIETQSAINLNDQNSSNEFLIHWTGRGKNAEDSFCILKKIIESKRLKFGTNSLVQESTRKKTPSKKLDNDSPIDCIQKMVCFTDIPIEQSKTICGNYNCFGIRFRKDALALYGVSPVHYILPQFYESYNNWSHEIFNNCYNGESTFDVLVSLCQPSQDCVNGKFIDFYKEQEWRLFPYNDNKSFQIEEEDGCYLQFSVEDVDSIIVLDSYLNEAREFLKKIHIDLNIIPITIK